ncbi:MAG: ABC-2 family transporter protein, partial [Pirellulaceae bacterium]
MTSKGEQPHYTRVLLTFARNSLIRDMTFRANFIIECIASLSWTMMNLGFYLLIFSHIEQRRIADWQQYEFFAFIATTWIVNSIVQTFFMPNAQEFSELIRTGNLDFALLKPIDTQFLISLQKMDWSSLSNLLAGGVLLMVSLGRLTHEPSQPLEVTPILAGMYVFYVLCGIAIMYSVMISLAATSIWLGRNQTLYDFWFYLTNFSRYPMEIYSGRFGAPLQWFFTFIVPVLIVVNVPARIVAQPLRPETSIETWLALFAIAATAGCLL